jgi:hypothetical protein
MNTKIYKHQWEVPSHSKDKTYKVSEKHTGEFVCSCPHNIFRKLECDHIREAQEFEKERKRLLEAQKRIKFFGITFLQ